MNTVQTTFAGRSPWASTPPNYTPTTPAMVWDSDAQRVPTIESEGDEHNGRNEAVLKFIQANPGCDLPELRRELPRTKIVAALLSLYHQGRVERAGTLHFYTYTAVGTAKKRGRIPERQSRIAEFLKAHPRSDSTAIAMHEGTNAALVGAALTKLIKEGVVTRSGNFRGYLYSVAPCH